MTKDSDVEEEKAAFVAAVNATKGYKTAFNSKLHNAQESVAMYAAAPSQASEKFAERDFQKADNYFDTLQDAYIRAINLAKEIPENLEGKQKIEKKLSDASASIDKLRDDLRKAIAIGYKAPVTTGTVPKTVVKSTTVQRSYNDALKPNMMQLDSNPTEFRTWKNTMVAYFEANEFTSDLPRVQNAYVMQCMSPEVRAMVEIQVDDAVAPFDGSTGTIAIMERLYSEIYTILQKRMNMMTAKMKAAETPAAFVARLNRLFLEADIESMTADDFKCFLLLAGITNEKLRTKMLEIKDPTYTELCRKVTTWMVTHSMEKALKAGNQSATINMVKKGKGGKGGKGGAGAGSGTKNPTEKTATQGAPPDSIKNTPMTLNGKCIQCGASNHEKSACPTDKGTLQCKKCNRKGHVEKVCLMEYNKWKYPSQGKATSASAPPARVRRVSTSSAEEEEDGDSQ